MKAKRQKLKFKPTSISRLARMTVPFKMVGDPPWCHQASGKAAWESRERAVYAHEMERKNWPMPWSPDIWRQAWQDNEHLDYLISSKWDKWLEALNDNWRFDYDAACRENAAWDYHHEYIHELA